MGAAASLRKRLVAPSRKATHSPAEVQYLDGATPELRNRVAYAICSAVYAGGVCACQQRKADACSTMQEAASRAILLIDELRPF